MHHNDSWCMHIMPQSLGPKKSLSRLDDACLLSGKNFGKSTDKRRMAGVKHRYIVVRIESKADAAIASNLKNLLHKSMKINFGDFILSLIDRFEVLENHESLGIVILKCNLAIYKYLCYTLVSLGRFNDINVRFSILACSGILRKAKTKLLRIINNESNGCDG